MFICESEEVLHNNITRESGICSSEVDGLVTFLKFVDSFAEKFEFVAYDWNKV